MKYRIAAVPALLFSSVAMLGAGCGMSPQSSMHASIAVPDDNGTPGENRDIVEFRIPAGTGTGSWNTEATEVAVMMGQTLRIINDDTVIHRLHTFGRPCPHGPNMAAAGGTYDCVVSQAYDRATNGLLYDHIVGPDAKFYLRVTAPPTPTPTPVPTTIRR